MKNALSKAAPGIIAGAIIGMVMWLASGTWWFLPAGVLLGLAVLPLIMKSEPQYHSRKRRDENFRD